MNVEGQDEDDFSIDDAAEEIGTELFNEAEPELDLEPAPEAPVVEPAPATPEANSPEVTALGAPDTWTKEAIAEWATVSPRVQQEILKREADMIKGFEAVQTYRTAAESYNEIISPYAQLFQQHNVDPKAMLSGFAYNHAVLSFGTPQEKLALAQNLLSSYQIDPVELALAMGQQKAVDPEVAALRQQVQQLTGNFNQIQQSQLSTAQAEAEAAVAAFASDPANLYFREVEDDILNLLKTGAARTLPEAYEKAVWTNESTRQKELARLAAPTPTPVPAPKPDQKARALASNVDATPKPGNGAMPVGSMEDTLEEAYASISSR